MIQGEMEDCMCEQCRTYYKYVNQEQYQAMGICQQDVAVTKQRIAIVGKHQYNTRKSLLDDIME